MQPASVSSPNADRFLNGEALMGLVGPSDVESDILRSLSQVAGCIVNGFCSPQRKSRTGRSIHPEGFHLFVVLSRRRRSRVLRLCKVDLSDHYFGGTTPYSR